jgi:hypothetical protein
LTSEITIDERTANALGLTRLDRTAVAHRLAELGGLSRPAQAQTQEFLVDVLMKAVSYIPATGAAWSWGEFTNGGIQPLFDIDRAHDRLRLATCAVDLGLDTRPPRTRPGETLSPREALSRNLTEAIEGLLEVVRTRLEAVGVSPQGQRAAPHAS